MKRKYAAEIQALAALRRDTAHGRLAAMGVLVSVAETDVPMVLSLAKKAKAHINRAAILATQEGKQLRKAYYDKPDVRTRNLARRIKYHASVQGRAVNLVLAAKARSKSKNMPCDITPEWVAKRIEIGFCQATSRRFDLYQGTRGIKSRSPNAPSLDQVIPGKGYTRENTRVVCLAYNLAKGEMSDAELLQLCRDILSTADM